MNELENLTTELNEDNDLGVTSKKNVHLDESALLYYVDSFFAEELYSGQGTRHLEECGFCKKKLFDYLNYYGFNELKLK